MKVLAQDFTGLKICINPGHGGYEWEDGQVYKTKYWESEGNLEKSLYYKKLLESFGAEVIITRTSNKIEEKCIKNNTKRKQKK